MIVFVDMDGVLCNFKEGCIRFSDKKKKTQSPLSKQGLFENLTPIAGAIPAVNLLRNKPERRCTH